MTKPVQLSLPAELLPTYAAPYVPAPKRKRGQQYAMFPMWWLEKMAAVKGKGSTDVWPLAIHILHKYWKSKSRPFKLSNEAVAYYLGMDRFRKSRALAILERCGLVWVDRRSRKSPFVEPILTPAAE